MSGYQSPETAVAYVREYRRRKRERIHSMLDGLMDRIRASKARRALWLANSAARKGAKRREWSSEAGS